jgi:hypothetical protein
MVLCRAPALERCCHGVDSDRQRKLDGAVVVDQRQ